MINVVDAPDFSLWVVHMGNWVILERNLIDTFGMGVFGKGIYGLYNLNFLNFLSLLKILDFY